MTIGPPTSVMQRIGAIETRFGLATQSGAGGRRPDVPTSLDFDAILDRSTSASTEELLTYPAIAPTPDRALLSPDLGTAASDIGSLMTELDRLAALGALASPSLPTDLTSGLTGPTTELDRLAAIGALPVGRPIASPAAGSGVGAVDASPVAVGAPALTTETAQGPVAAATPFAAEFERAGAAYGVPPRLLAAVGWVESRYQTDALSPDGAIGVMQIMPMTAQELGVDPHDPVDAIDGAARLLAAHERRFGSWDLALAAYHSGAGAVSRNGNQPPPRAATYVGLVHDRLEHV